MNERREPVDIVQTDEIGLSGASRAVSIAAWALSACGGRSGADAVTYQCGSNALEIQALEKEIPDFATRETPKVFEESKIDALEVFTEAPICFPSRKNLRLAPLRTTAM